MSQILRTRDYNIFKIHEKNRYLNKTNVKLIEKSIRENNLLKFKPILVDASMYVLDGQHRLEIAQKLGLDVFYQIKEDADARDMILLNSNQKQWTLDDYIHYYVEDGNLEYQKLHDYCEKKDVKPSMFLFICDGIAGTHTIKNGAIKDGSFKFISEQDRQKVDTLLEDVETVLATIRTLSISDPKFHKAFKLKQAIVMILRNEHVGVKMLITKITFNAQSLGVRASCMGYYNMLRDMYNWKNSRPIK